jgi:hypothetical protein
LLRVRAHALVGVQGEGEPEGAVGVRALAEKLIRNVWPESMSQGLDALVHLPEESLVLREPLFTFVHVCSTPSALFEFRSSEKAGTGTRCPRLEK